MIVFDLALGHGVIGPGADMPDIVIFEVVFQFMRDEAWPVVREQPGTMVDMDMFDPGSGYGHVQGFLNLLRDSPSR